MANASLDTVGQPCFIADAGLSLPLGANGAVTLELNTDGSATQKGGLISQVSGLTTLATAGNETYTAAQLKTGLIRRDCGASGRTDTTDTAANIIAGIPALNVDGATHVVYLINTSAGASAITLGAGAGVTISNVGQTLAQNEAAILLFRRTSSSAVSLDIIGA